MAFSKKHKQRREDEEEQAEKGRKKVPKLVIMSVALAAVGVTLVTVVLPMFRGKGEKAENQESAPPDPTASVEPGTGALPWNLIVVSAQQPLPRSYTLDLETIEKTPVPNTRLDVRAASDYRRMISDARSAGAVFYATSSYRGVKKQGELYDAEVQKYLDQGRSKADAEKETGRYLQPPGCSEHHTGLAIDVVTEDHQTLDTAFEDTAAFQWLSQHAAEYGFILRYPRNKEEVTGIAYEPWHYRYVGREDAARIAGSGLCLEEYVELYKNGELDAIGAGGATPGPTPPAEPEKPVLDDGAAPEETAEQTDGGADS